MAIEIERKFLLRKEDVPDRAMVPRRSFSLAQGYLDEKGTTRVRISTRNRDGDIKAFLTLKSKGLFSRKEFEYEIPVSDAREILSMCKYTLEKTRFISFEDADGTPYETDVFSGKHHGLLMVEVEFDSEERANSFVPPSWFGPEVTRDPRYTNANLAKSGEVPVYGEQP